MKPLNTVFCAMAGILCLVLGTAAFTAATETNEASDHASTATGSASSNAPHSQHQEEISSKQRACSTPLDPPTAVDMIFMDGFETGDTSRWSDTVEDAKSLPTGNGKE